MGSVKKMRFRSIHLLKLGKGGEQLLHTRHIEVHAHLIVLGAFDNLKHRTLA